MVSFWIVVTIAFPTFRAANANHVYAQDSSFSSGTAVYSDVELQKQRDAEKQAANENLTKKAAVAATASSVNKDDSLPFWIYPVIAVGALFYLPVKAIGPTIAGYPALEFGYKNEDSFKFKNISANLSLNGLNDYGFGLGLGGTVFFDQNLPTSNDFPCPHGNWTSQGYYNNNPTFGLDLKLFVPPFYPNKYISLYVGCEAFLVQQLEIQKSSATGDLFQGQSRLDAFTGYEYGAAFRYDKLFVTAGNSSARGLNFSVGWKL